MHTLNELQKNFNEKELNIMKEKKMTKKDYFNLLLTKEEVKTDEKLVKFIENELNLLAKKSSGEKKPTAVQLANEEIKESILDYMTANPNLVMTITDMQKNIEGLAELSNQKVSALVRQLKDEGKVEKIEEKRKSYFRLEQ